MGGEGRARWDAMQGAKHSDAHRHRDIRNAAARPYRLDSADPISMIQRTRICNAAMARKARFHVQVSLRHHTSPTLALNFRPLGVEGLAHRLVGALVGVRAKEVALRLQQVGGQAGGAIAVVVA